MTLDLCKSFTWREIEVLWLLDARLSTEEIAAVLNLPPWAVQSYRSRIEQKLTLRLLSPHVPERGSPDGSPP
jgi:DNA-binding NarL/FixJ family response regulator